MRKPLAYFLAVSVFLTLAPSALAAPGDLDATYNPGAARPRIAKISALGVFDDTYPAGTGFNGDVRALVRQADGKMVVGGDFTSFNGTGRNRVARLNADGSLDGAFDPGTGFNGAVDALILDGTDIYVGGEFTSFNGTTRNYIARLNSDGSLDTGFAPSGTGFNNHVYALALDGTDVYAGGYFSTFNGTSRKNIVRLNTDGTLDAGFDPGTGFEVSNPLLDTSYVSALLLDGTDIYVGGRFVTFNGTDRSRIARINTDGSVDAGFDPGTGFNDVVYSLALEGTDIYVGGAFSTYNGSSRVQIARVNTDGSIDAGFVPAAIGGGGEVRSIVLDGTDVVLGGDFSYISGSGRKGIVRFNTNGTLDAGFDVGAGVNDGVRAVVMDGANVVIGGTFVVDLNTSFDDLVKVVLAQSDGKVIVGGDFTSFSGTSRNRIARLNADGTLDVGFDPGTGFSGGSVLALALDGTDIYAGGAFTSFNGTSRNYIARLNTNGSIDAGFDPGTGFNSTVSALAMSGTDVYAGGGFTSFNGTARNRIARLNTDGSIDAGFDPGTGFDTGVNALAVTGTDVYAGGQFTSFDGTARNYIARLNSDGSLDSGFAPTGTGLDSTVFAIALDSADIYVGGAFTSFNGTSRNYIARLNSDGSLDAGFGPGTGLNGNVYTLAMDGTDVAAGGDFGSYQGTSRPYIIRINPTGSVDTAFNSTTTGFDGRVSSITPVGTDFVVGGSFLTYRGTGAVRLSKLSATDPAGFTIAITGVTTDVSESGTSDTFTAVLDEQPASDVVLTVVSSDLGEATVAPASLTFTSSNWYVPQTVTVTGVDDTDVDGSQTVSVTMSVSDAASSNEYDPVADQVVSATVGDDDAGGGGNIPNTISLTSPNGGETLQASQQKQVTWAYGGSANHTVNVSLSTDGGTTYALVAALPGQDTGLYVWTVPDVNTSAAKLKVEFMQFGAAVASDVSDAVFSIAGTTGNGAGAGTGAGAGAGNGTPAPITNVDASNASGVYVPSASINEDHALVAAPASANCVSGSLIRIFARSSVYYCGADGKRYVFPNEKIYLSWYADFSGIDVISAEKMATVPLGGNVTYKPGTRMIKIESDPKVYVVSRGGVLRWVPTEEIAARLYGAAWNKKIDDVAVSFFTNYRLGTVIAASEVP